MLWSELRRPPTERMLRQFGGLCLLIFGALAAWQWWGRSNPLWAGVFAALALTLGPLGLLWPRAVRPIFVGWMFVAAPIGWVVSHVVLGLLFYGMFTPLACVFRFAGRDVLQRRFEADRESYWLPKTCSADVSGYFRQF